MNLTGNKLASILLALCSITNSYAEESEIELTGFIAGTPAKAADVNGNFQSLKTYIKQLEARVKNLERGGYNIPVYGDGKLIGHSLSLPTFEIPYPKIKTELGIFSIDTYKLNETGIISLKVADAVRAYSIVYNDAQCSESPHMIYDLKAYELLVAPRDTTDRDYLLTNASSYFIPKDTSITKNVDPTLYYTLDNEQACIAANSGFGNTVIPLQALPDDIQLTFNKLSFGKSE